MPNGWFDQTDEAVAFLQSEEWRKQIAEWQKANPDLRLPISHWRVWDDKRDY